jgi:hypothetical protein
MAYSAQEKAAAQGAQDWLNAGNQWMVDIMGWDWFFQTQPQFAPYRDAVMNRSAVLSEPAAPAPTPAPTPAPANQDSNIGKVYNRIQDVPEGYDWEPTAGLGTPMTNKEDIMATLDAMNRGELTDYQKQFTYRVTGKKPENVLFNQGPGLYTYVKDGKEYVYAPKEFVNYGSQGTEAEAGDLGKPFSINSLLKYDEVLDKAEKTNIDPEKFKGGLDNSGIQNPYQGYSWKKKDYEDAVYSLSGGRPTTYNYDPNDVFKLGNRTIYPEQYGAYQGQDENGNYIYKKGKNTTVFDPKTATGTIYWPGDDDLLSLLPFIAIAGLAFGIPAGLEFLAGEAAGAGALGAGFGELSAAELASYGVTAETLGLGAAGGTSLASAGWDPNWLSSVGQGAGDIAAGQASSSMAATLNDIRKVYNLAKTGYNLATSNDPLKALVNSGVSMGTSAITSEIPGFGELSDAQKKIANSVISSTLTGQDPTQALVNSALNTGVAAINITSQIPGYDSLSLDQRKAVDNAIYTTLRGGNPTQSLVDSAINAGINAAKDPYTALRNAGLLEQSTGNTDEDSGQTITPDDSSPSGYRDIIGNPVNYDGTPYVPGTASGTIESPTDVGKTDLTPTEEPQCPPGFHWNGSMCVSDEDVADTSTSCPDGYVFDLNTQSCVPVGTTTGSTTNPNLKFPTTPTTPKAPTTTPTTPKPPTTATTPTTPTTPGMTTGTPTGTAPGTTADNTNNLLAALALMGNQSQPTTPTPLADIKYYYDFGDDSLVPKKPDNQSKNPAFGFFDGGEVDNVSVDDLIRMLQGD